MATLPTLGTTLGNRPAGYSLTAPPRAPRGSGGGGGGGGIGGDRSGSIMGRKGSGGAPSSAAAATGTRGGGGGGRGGKGGMNTNEFEKSSGDFDDDNNVDGLLGTPPRLPRPLADGMIVGAATEAARWLAVDDCTWHQVRHAPVVLCSGIVLSAHGFGHTTDVPVWDEFWIITVTARLGLLDRACSLWNTMSDTQPTAESLRGAHVLQSALAATPSSAHIGERTGSALTVDGRCSPREILITAGNLDS